MRTQGGQIRSCEMRGLDEEGRNSCHLGFRLRWLHGRDIFICTQVRGERYFAFSAFEMPEGSLSGMMQDVIRCPSEVLSRGLCFSPQDGGGD